MVMAHSVSMVVPNSRKGSRCVTSPHRWIPYLGRADVVAPEKCVQEYFLDADFGLDGSSNTHISIMTMVMLDSWGSRILLWLGRSVIGCYKQVSECDHHPPRSHASNVFDNM